MRVKDRMGLTKNDCLRLKRSMAYCIRQNQHLLSVDDLHVQVMNVVDHHFGVHSGCGAWCWPKNKTPEEISKSGRIYRCQIRDAPLHKFCRDHTAKFHSKTRLIDVLDSDSTNPVESKNS